VACATAVPGGAGRPGRADAWLHVLRPRSSAVASWMVAKSMPSSCAHRCSGAAIGRPRSGSCQVPTDTAYRTRVRGSIGNATDCDRTGRRGTEATGADCRPDGEPRCVGQQTGSIHLPLSDDPSRYSTVRRTCWLKLAGSDTEEVTGSNPVAPTTKPLTSENAVAFTTMALSRQNPWSCSCSGSVTRAVYRMESVSLA
jgi:hypothetical protein